jgi:hypothetical protein
MRKPPLRRRSKEAWRRNARGTMEVRIADSKVKSQKAKVKVRRRRGGRRVLGRGLGLIFQVGGGQRRWVGFVFQLDGDFGEAGVEGLAAFELVEGAVEGVFEAHLQQGEVMEGLGGVGVAAGNVGGAEVRGEGLKALVVLLEGVGAEVVVVGFALAEAAEAPPGVGDALDQDGLVGAGGLEVVFEGGGILAGEDGEAGGEAVLPEGRRPPSRGLPGAEPAAADRN